MVAWRYEIYLLVLKNVSLVRANYKRRTAHGKNKKGGVRKSPCPRLTQLHRQSVSLFMYADDHQIMMYRRPPKFSGDKQWYKEKLLQASPQKYQILTSDRRKPLSMRDEGI